MKIAIIGFGVEGKAAYEYWRETKDSEITICDNNEKLDLPSDIEAQLGKNYLDNLERFDLVVRSPGVKPEDIIDSNNPDILDKVTSCTNEFFRVNGSANVIGVTGTKGKGTTSTLIYKMLEAAGFKTYIGGNIGLPAIKLLAKDVEDGAYVVLELSSFQLSDIRYSPHIGVCLLVEPDHLDWHNTFDNYLNAKANLFRQQNTEDIAIYYSDSKNSAEVVSVGQGTKIPFFSLPGAYVKGGEIIIGGHVICSTNELKLLGEHNWQNVCAAITAIWQITKDTEAIKNVLTSFSGLPYRIELRAEKGGHKFYNDSFASDPSALSAFLSAVPASKVMIVGGYDRMLNLNSLVRNLKNHEDEIRNILVIGASGSRLIGHLEKAGFSKFTRSEAADMKSIVKQATDLAKPGDAIALSPGFASYDMFSNFEERGNKFNEAVDAL